MRGALCVLSVCVLFGCSQELTGPSPTILGEPGSEEPEGAPTSPGFVCNEQQDVWIELRGAGFSPLVIDVIDDEKDASTLLPEVTLTRRSDVEGAEEGESFEVVLKSTDDEDTHVRWIDANLMKIRIEPSLALPPGVYDVKVTNPNGNSGVFEGALGITQRPVVTGVVEDLLCVAQSARQVVVSGDHFVVRGEELPEVVIGTSRYRADAASDCRDLAPVFGNYKLCRALDVTIPEGDLDVGQNLIEVVNIPPAGCQSLSAEDGVAVTVVPPPVVAEIEPEPICSEQLDYDEVRVTGEGFLKIVRDGQESLPTVRVGEQTYAAEAVEDCAPLAGPVNESAEVCSVVRFAIPAGNQPPGDQPVEVENPQPAGCTSTEALGLAVVPPPSIEGIAPQPICTVQGDNTLTVTGANFLVLADAGPTVAIGEQTYEADAGDCGAVEGLDETAQSCGTLTITVPQNDLPESGRFDVSVTNPDPAGCVTTETVTLTVVPPPTLTAAIPDFFCSETGEVGLTLEGEGFIAIDGVLPSVSIGAEVVVADAVDGCEGIDGLDGVETCTSLSLTAPQGLGGGLLDVSVTNPDPAGCVSETIEVLDLPAPTLTGVVPVLFCSLEEAELVVTGEDILVIEGRLPVLSLGGESFGVSSVDGCEAVEGVDGVERCTQASVTVPQGALGAGVHELSLQNPDPAGCTSVEEAPVRAVVTGGPVIETHTPAAVCRGQFDGQITLEGTGFFEVEGNLPTVLINGDRPAQVLGAGACEDIEEVGGLRSCGSLDILVPEDLRDQDLSVSLTNPAPADCGFSELELNVEEPPVVDDVQPRKICDTGGALTITGDHFVEGMTVTLDGVAAQTVEVISPTEAVATWTEVLEPGLRELVATNPSGCFGAFETLIRVTSGPVVFFVDPPVVFNGISIQVTIFLGNLFGGSVEQVLITDSEANTTELQFTFDPQQANRVQAIIPAGLAADVYDVTLIDEVDCAGTTEDLVRVTDEVRVALGQVVPGFGWTETPTPIIIEAQDPIPQDQVGFSPTPRVYLSPIDPQPGDIAAELRATTMVSESELNGIVRDGLPPGLYDLIAVNPDGTVGVLEDAFTVTLLPPPVVLTVSPGSWETNLVALPVTIDGAGFRNPSVSAECRDSGGNALSEPTFVVNSHTDAQILAQVNTSVLAHLSVCVIRVTNEDDTFEEFSPVTVTNPAGNFVSFREGSSLVTPRRAPAVFSGTPSRVSRFLYAIGGDDGGSGGAIATGEYSVLNRFGELSEWSPLPAALPVPRTLTRAARIEDFVYLPGGHDGNGAVDTVMRAQVLNPLDVPVIDGLDFEFEDDIEGMPTGVFYYRVSALFSEDDAANPGGESLPSEPQPVFIPDLPVGVSLILEWRPMPRAVAYKIYRSPSPDQIFGEERLMAEVPSNQTTFVDDGTGETGEGQALPIGALGAWHDFAALAGARFNHGVVVAPDPVDPVLRHLYVVGGEDGQSVLASIERVTVSVDAPGEQSLVGQADFSDALADPRAELEALVAFEANASLLNGGQVLLYALSGRGSGDITDVVVAEVQAGGALGGFATTERLRPFASGYAAAVANNTLVAIGGQGGGPSDSGKSSEITNTGGDLSNWNSLGNTNVTSRYLMGREVFGGFFYLVGGQTNQDASSATTDFSILGGVP